MHSWSQRFVLGFFVFFVAGQENHLKVNGEMYRYIFGSSNQSKLEVIPHFLTRSAIKVYSPAFYDGP